MPVLNLNMLNGVDAIVKPTIYAAMKSCKNSERLCVCLYLLSDLSNDGCSLDMIEENLAKIFPPSIPHGNIPTTYKDFAATAIRQYFNYETIDARNGVIKPEHRLWNNPQLGYWMNTPLGNAYALRILKEKGITILKRGIIQNP